MANKKEKFNICEDCGEMIVPAGKEYCADCPAAKNYCECCGDDCDIDKDFCVKCIRNGDVKYCDKRYVEQRNFCDCCGEDMGEYNDNQDEYCAECISIQSKTYT